jgi:hypothetical protein
MEIPSQLIAATYDTSCALVHRVGNGVLVLDARAVILYCTVHIGQDIKLIALSFVHFLLFPTTTTGKYAEGDERRKSCPRFHTWGGLLNEPVVEVAREGGGTPC